MGAKRKASPTSTAAWERGAVRRSFLIAEASTYAYQLGDEAFLAQCHTEFPNLKDTVYLDSSASPPAPASTVRAFADSVTSTLFSNPHSRSASSQVTADEISSVRTRILTDLFGLASPSARSHWDVIFTSGATAALKLVGESYAWGSKEKGSPKATYHYLKHAHTSLVGIRGVALDRGAPVSALNLDDVEAWIGKETTQTDDLVDLFAYPAQCNATGARLGLELCQKVKQHRPSTAVLLDAAAYLATTPLDLGSIPITEAPDFIPCSFYKLYGYPTGLGCLVVKLSSTRLLLSRISSRSYFGGGTVDALSVSSPYWSVRRGSSTSTPTPPSLAPIHTAFEDGTLPFLSIIALGHAMTNHQKLYGSHASVSKHTASLARLTRQELASLQHANGQPVVQLHSAFDSATTTSLEPGPVVSLTLLDSTSAPVGHVFLDRLATINGFQIRSGGMCNTGVLASTSGLTDEDLLEAYQKGRRCWDDEEFADVFNHKPLGLARVSFGAMSTVDDVLDWIQFVRRYFVTSSTVLSVAADLPPRVDSPEISITTLASLMLYPIKSCGGQAVPPSASWEITPTGLAFDREWMLVSPFTGQTLSQKRIPRMALIRPTVDVKTGVLRVRAEGMSELILPLHRLVPDAHEDEDDLSEAMVCGDSLLLRRETPEVDAWFEEFLGVPCRLHRYPPGGQGRHGHFDRAPQVVPILLSNESPFLLITQQSVDQVNEWITSDSGSDSTLSSSGAPAIHSSCFRANFILSASETNSPPPFFEDHISLLRIGSPSVGATFQVLARCRRCLMVCVDQETGCKTAEPFSCLAKTRKSKRGRIEFGVHLFWRQDLSPSGSSSVRVGDRVVFSVDD